MDKQNTSTDKEVRNAIRKVVVSLMDRVMDKVLVNDPFIPERHHASKPLYAALVPDEIFKGSHFERRFVTPFGNAWERLAVEVGKVYHGDCRQGYSVEGTVGEESLRRIQEVLNAIEHGAKGQQHSVPCWEKELEYIKDGGGKPLPVSVVCDILIHSGVTGKRLAFELKGPLPNSDQTKVSKEKMFKLLAMNEHPIDNAYYALPYNPYGKRENYQWPFANRWFDMKKDESVLIGDELWNLLGGNGTYRMFVDEMNQLGSEYKERIYRDYLGIEPPQGFDKTTLK